MYKYVQSQPGYWVKEDSPYFSEDDLSDITVAVQSDTNLHRYLQQKPQLKISPTKTSFLALKEIFINKAEAAAEEESIMFYQADSYKDKPVRFIPFSDFDECRRVVVSASNDRQDIINNNNINRGLEAIMSKAKYQKINEKWFGEHANDILVQ